MSRDAIFEHHPTICRQFTVSKRVKLRHRGLPERSPLNLQLRALAGGTEVRFGSLADKPSQAKIATDCPLCAKNELMHRSKPHLYSITSSARPMSVLGTLRPSAFAVLRLIIISTFVAC